MEFIKDDIPKKEPLPPPLAMPAPLKVEPPARPVLLNKDPRQRLVKPVPIPKPNNSQNIPPANAQLEKKVKEEDKI
jgi:hypothetical protein